MDAHIIIPIALAILLLPLLGFIILIFTGKRLPRQGDWLATSLLTVSLGLSLYILFQKLALAPAETISQSFTWVTLGVEASIPIEFGIMIDNLTAVMLVVVTLISTLVHFFSMAYMKGDVRYSRYFATLCLFSFSMLGIVLTNNLLMMYIFWELVGVSSYLLIGHWYEKKSASNAANKAFIVNRVGDACMFIGIMILFTAFATFGFESIFAAIESGNLPSGSTGWLTASGILIFCGAVGKSAQFPLQVWLPDAMEGPTPVSALIHAATMVAAGVYLVARIFPMLTASALLVIAYIGAITALIAATIAVTQFDIKKVLAYSTVSQLGYMVMALGVGAYTAGIMHLVTHAAFKAGLFLASACIIYAMHNALHHQNDHKTDAQDIRNMGGLKSKMPVTYWTFLVFTLAISGIPLTSGFLSKDEVLAGTLGFASLSGHFLLPLIGFAVAGLTAFYMFRLLILTFHGKSTNPALLDSVKEAPSLMTVPLVILAALSLFFFYSYNPIGATSGWFWAALERPESIVPVSVQPYSIELFGAAVSSVHTIAMILSVIIALAGIWFAWQVYSQKTYSSYNMANRLGWLYRGSASKWYFDAVYQKVFVTGSISFSRKLHQFDDTIIDGAVNGVASIAGVFSRISRWIDEHLVDGLVRLTANATGAAGRLIPKFQTGKVQTYVAFIIAGFILLLVFFI